MRVQIQIWSSLVRIRWRNSRDNGDRRVVAIAIEKVEGCRQ